MTDCTRCGACCACYTVDFAQAECGSHGGRVPDSLAEPVTATTVRLRGTDHQQPRCAALSGRIGQAVQCAIYPWRPSPYRELAAGSDACARARRRHGLDGTA